MFFEAQIVTQELKRGDDNIDKQGHVYLYPESTLGRTDLTRDDTLIYIPYQSSDPDDDTTFKKRVEANDSDIQEYFSINSQGQLVLAALTTEEVKINGSTESTTYTAREIPIDYKSMISQYATPMAFYLELGMVTRNPEFLEAVTNLAKQRCNIQLTVLNNTTVDVTVQVDKSTEHVRSRKIVEDPTGTLAPTIEYESSDETTTTTTTTTKTVVTPTVKVTSVDTWLCSQKITYSKIPGAEITSSDTIPQPSDDALSLDPNSTEEETVSWTTREPSTVNRASRSDTYDSGIATEYTDNTDEFIALLDNVYELPNSKEKRTAGAYLKTDAELFFQLLSQNPETQGMELVMRYIMQKYDNNRDYGAADFSFNMFNPGTFSTITGIYGSSVEEKFWYALKRIGYSSEAIAGAMGNIYRESQFNPTALNSSSGAYGLAQWKDGRRDSLQDYASSKGKTEEDEDCQIEFLIAEITGTGDAASYATKRTAGGVGENYYNFNDWVNATDEKKAAVAFCWFFETPSGEATKTDAILSEERIRSAHATRYYLAYKDRGVGGTTGTSNNASVRCYYTSASGRKFTILDQTKIPSFNGRCNAAACAIIASGHSSETPEQLINTRNSHGGDLYGAISGNSYWNKYGLQITKKDDNLNLANYTEELRTQLVSGGYAMVWLTNKPYYGKSGTKWTEEIHWVAIIDYKYENGVEKMAVADWRGITWVGVDEFTTHGVTHMVFVNEK